MLALTSVQTLIKLLISRATDAEADLPSRSHAAASLAELIETRSPWTATVPVEVDAAD